MKNNKYHTVGTVPTTFSINEKQTSALGVKTNGDHFVLS
jgi:hypothetical protein